MAGRNSGGGAIWIVGAVILLGLAAGIYFLVNKPAEKPRKVVPELQMTKILPPPPPPPPPPPKTPPPPTPQKMTEAPKMSDPMKPAPSPSQNKPAANPAPAGPPDLGLAKGDGPGDGFGASGNGGGGDGSGGGGGSLEGWYAGVMQSAMMEAVNRDGRLKRAKGDIKVRVWRSPDGAVTKVSFEGQFTDPSLNAVLEDIILHKMTVSEPPPKEIPQPTVFRFRAGPPGSS